MEADDCNLHHSRAKRPHQGSFELGQYPRGQPVQKPASLEYAWCVEYIKENEEKKECEDRKRERRQDARKEKKQEEKRAVEDASTSSKLLLG